MTDKLDLFSCSQSHLNLNEIDFFNIRIASHSFTISPILITPSICWMEAFTPDLIYERTLESNVKLLLIFGSSSNKINIQHQHWVVILLDFISDLSRPRFPQAKWRYELTSCKNYDSNCIVYYIIRRMIKSYSYVVEKGFSLLGSKKWCLFVVSSVSVGGGQARLAWWSLLETESSDSSEQLLQLTMSSCEWQQVQSRTRQWPSRTSSQPSPRCRTCCPVFSTKRARSTPSSAGVRLQTR